MLKDVVTLAALMEKHIGCGHAALYKVDAPHLAPLSVVRIAINYKDPTGAQCQLGAEITEKGDVYNPTFHGPLLSILFDWTRRFGYKRERIIERTNLFRDELISAVLFATATHINDSLVPVQ